MLDVRSALRRRISRRSEHEPVELQTRPQRCEPLLVYRRDDDAVRVLLAHMGGPYWARKDHRAWTIPKGEYGAGENPLMAACWEFAEEMGSPPPSAAARSEELGEIRQSGGKIVTAWA